jgi:diguanylate cyclase (GGDEF)-like protein
MVVQIASHTLGRSGQGRSFSLTIAVAIGAMVVVSLFLACVGVYWATHESDAVSVERQARSAQHAMELSVDELALQQETVAIWDDAARRLVAVKRDQRWVHDNMTGWLNRIFGHDAVFVLDGHDRPTYAAIEGEAVPVDRYDALSADLRHLLDSVRGRNHDTNGRHDRIPGQRPHPQATIRTTPRASHASHLMLVGGRPAAASAMLVRPSTENYVQPNGEWPVLISVRYLDANFLVELSSRQLISAPRFSRRPVRTANEHAVPLRTEWGATIGYLVWRPELPGTRILWKLGPLNLLILFGLATFMAFLGRRLRNSASELAAAEAHSAHLAFHDALTGLPNRSLFQRRLDELSRKGASSDFALALLDVDDFKLINDTQGHDAGDALLLAFAERLLAAVGPQDLVARLGGDEFALLLMGRSDARQLEEFSTRLLERLREPCEHRGDVIQCGASIGASSFKAVGSAQNMLKHADLALYEAKASGRGAFRLYDPSMSLTMVKRGKMLSLAASALKGELIVPFYQPKVHLRSGQIIGFEALLRCCLPGEPARGPGSLAAAFEDSNLAVLLSDRMVEGVIGNIAAWRAAGLPFGHVAINAALAELRRGDFAERLLAKLDRAGIPPNCIQVEVTESVLLGRGIEHVERTFHELADKGIRLALDDFGTGFASLTHLKRFPIEIIKIDRSFVRDLQIDAEDGAIVEALIGLGHALKIEVVAEGIETRAQRDFLDALGCSVGQGYLYGGALPAAEIPALLRGSSHAIRAVA